MLILPLGLLCDGTEELLVCDRLLVSGLVQAGVSSRQGEHSQHKVWQQCTPLGPHGLWATAPLTWTSALQDKCNKRQNIDLAHVQH